jgi:hypothetical protein
MRWCWALLVGQAFLSSGCSGLIARSGEDVTNYSNREEVHHQFGMPNTTGTTNGVPFEEFQTRRKICEWKHAYIFDLADWGTFGLTEFVFLPLELLDNGERIVMGKKVRITYDESGQVINVYLDGESLKPPFDRLDSTPKTNTSDKQP